MKAKIVFPALVLSMPLWGAPPAAEVDPETIRGAVERSLPLLEKTGPIFFEKAGGISCHNQSLPAMAMRLARDKGFSLDEKASRAHVKNAAAFWGPLTEDHFQLEDVPGDTATIGYTLMGLAADEHAADKMTDAFVLWTAATQRLDGSWRDHLHRPPIEYSPVTATALGVRTLQLYGPAAKGDEFGDRIARARAWIGEAEARNTEERAFRLLGLEWAAGTKNAVRKAAEDLLRSQRADGGWAQLPGLPSDAYATGQALYALHTAGGMQAGAKDYRRGLGYLLRTQLDDGSWHVATRSFPFQPYFESGFPHGPDQWISAAGTSWAVMALTLAVDSP